MVSFALALVGDREPKAWRVQAVARRSRTGRTPGLDEDDAHCQVVDFTHDPPSDAAVRHRRQLGRLVVALAAGRLSRAFAGCWSHVPDPIDFHDFQGIDLYDPLPDGKPRNMYVDEHGAPRPLARKDGKVLLTYEDFVRREDVLNPSGQIRSFEATFSPPAADGTPRRRPGARTTSRIACSRAGPSSAGACAARSTSLRSSASVRWPRQGACWRTCRSR